MIQITPHMRILVCIEPVDFRRGIDGLACICRSLLKTNPMSGYLFVFRNKRKTAIKLICYDGQGFWLFQKRLSSGRFKWWPESKDSALSRLAVHELQLLIWNGDISSARVAPFWKEIDS